MKLRVPFKKQTLRYSCFSACVRMVLSYYEDDISEKELYKETLLSIIPKGIWDARMALFLIKRGYKVATYINGPPLNEWRGRWATEYKKHYHKALKLGLQRKQNATISLIRRLLDNKTPVLTEVNLDRFYHINFNPEETHMILAVGYTKKYFYFHDPHPKAGGKYKKVSIKKFNDAWQKLSGPWGRSIFVILSS